MLPFFVIIPLGCAFLISLVGKKSKYAGDILANLSTLFLLGLSLYSIGLVAGHKTLVYKVDGLRRKLYAEIHRQGQILYLIYAHAGRHAWRNHDRRFI